MSYDPDDLDTPATSGQIAEAGRRRLAYDGEERRKARDAYEEEIGARAGQLARAEAVIRAMDAVDLTWCEGGAYERYRAARSKYRLGGVGL